MPFASGPDTSPRSTPLQNMGKSVGAHPTDCPFQLNTPLVEPSTFSALRASAPVTQKCLDHSSRGRLRTTKKPILEPAGILFTLQCICIPLPFLIVDGTVKEIEISLPSGVVVAVVVVTGVSVSSDGTDELSFIVTIFSNTKVRSVGTANTVPAPISTTTQTVIGRSHFFFFV